MSTHNVCCSVEKYLPDAHFYQEVWLILFCYLSGNFVLAKLQVGGQLYWPKAEGQYIS